MTDFRCGAVVEGRSRDETAWACWGNGTCRLSATLGEFCDSCAPGWSHNLVGFGHFYDCGMPSTLLFGFAVFNFTGLSLGLILMAGVLYKDLIPRGNTRKVVGMMTSIAICSNGVTLSIYLQGGFYEGSIVSFALIDAIGFCVAPFVTHSLLRPVAAVTRRLWLLRKFMRHFWTFSVVGIMVHVGLLLASLAWCRDENPRIYNALILAWLWAVQLVMIVHTVSVLLLTERLRRLFNQAVNASKRSSVLAVSELSALGLASEGRGFTEASPQPQLIPPWTSRGPHSEHQNASEDDASKTAFDAKPDSDTVASDDTEEKRLEKLTSRRKGTRSIGVESKQISTKTKDRLDLIRGQLLIISLFSWIFLISSVATIVSLMSWAVTGSAPFSYVILLGFFVVLALSYATIIPVVGSRFFPANNHVGMHGNVSAATIVVLPPRRQNDRDGSGESEAEREDMFKGIVSRYMASKLRRQHQALAARGRRVVQNIWLSRISEEPTTLHSSAVGPVDTVHSVIAPVIEQGDVSDDSSELNL